MSRTLSAPQVALTQAKDRAHHQRVWIGPAGGALVDLSDYLLPGTVHEQGINEQVDALTLYFDRSIGASSLSPLMTEDPPIDLGHNVIWETAVTDLITAPGSSDWIELFRGTVRLVDPTRNPMQVVCQDLAGTLRERLTAPGQTIVAGTQLEDAIQAVVTEAPGPTIVTLDVPESPDASLVEPLAVSHEPVLQATQSLADSIGWSTRYWWNETAGTFLFSLLEPPRDKTVADWTTGPNRYLDVQELKLDKTDIRNDVTVYYGPKDENGEQEFVHLDDPASIAKYGLLPAVFREGTNSPIQSVAQATAFATAALSDLSEPDATHAVTDFDLPQIQIWDLIEFAPNNVHYNATQKLAVQAIRREYPAPGVGRITLYCRGKPSAGIGTWKRRAREGRFIEAITEPPISAYMLFNFREIASPDPLKRRFAWDGRGARVASVWWKATSFVAPWTDDNWPIVADAVVPVPPLQEYVDVPVVAANHAAGLQVEPRKADGSVHSDLVIERVVLYPVPPKIHGAIDARVDGDAVDIYATANPTASALPIAWEVREETQAGTLLASGSFTSIADAQTGVGPSTTVGLNDRPMPPLGKRTWWLKLTDVAGNVEWLNDSVDAPRLPYFDRIKQSLAVDLLSIDFFGRVVDPLGMGGDFFYWLPADATTPADPDAAATGGLNIPSTPYSFGPSTIPLLGSIDLAPGTTLGIYLEFIAGDGRTTGRQYFPLEDSMQVLVDELGQLRAESVYNGLVLAQQYRPYYLGTGAPSLTPAGYGTNLYFDTATLTPYKHDGTSWAVDLTTPAVAFAPILRAGVILGVHIDVTSLIAEFAGINRLTSSHLNIGALSLIASDAGAIVSGSFINAGATAGLDLDATGTDAVLWAPGFEILANGDADYSGDISASRIVGSLSVPASTGHIDFTNAGGSLYSREHAYSNISGIGVRWQAMIPGGGGDPSNPADFVVMSWQAGAGGSGTFFVQGLGIFERLNIPALPTSDPGIPGEFWNDSGSVKVSL